MTYEKQTEKMLARIIPFDQWKEETNPTPDDCKMYWYIKNGLEKMLKMALQKKGSTGGVYG